MKIQQPLPSLTVRSQFRAGGNDPQPPEDPKDRVGRGQSFYQGAASTSKWMSRINGGLVGANVGFKVGAVAGAVLTGRLGGTALMSLAGGAGLAVAGYCAMDAVSGFAGSLGRDLDTGNGLRGEALGRTALNAGLSVLGGHGWAGVISNASLSAVGGVVNYALN